MSDKKKGQQKHPKQPQKKADDSPDKLLRELETKCDEHLAGWQRALADYQNLQKETQKRISDNMKYATEEFLMELLPMVDHFKFAFRAVPEEQRNSDWLKGMEHIQSNFMKILEEHGLETIPTVGEPFDPQIHEAVEEVAPDKEKESESGTVAEEVATGFRLKGKVIQPAKVKVYK
ncbi:MAG: nucleotide exchange factor GrpE [Candidatus Kerfeldbacteria bacterium]